MSKCTECRYNRTLYQPLFVLTIIASATANKIGFIDHVSLSADPIHIPGDETASLQIHILRPIDGSYTVKVRVQKKLLFGFVEIPCSTETNIGSWYGSYSYLPCIFNFYLFKLLKKCFRFTSPKKVNG